MIIILIFNITDLSANIGKPVTNVGEKLVAENLAVEVEVEDKKDSFSGYIPG